MVRTAWAGNRQAKLEAGEKEVPSCWLETFKTNTKTNYMIIYKHHHSKQAGLVERHVSNLI